MSIISLIIAEMSTHDLQDADHFDHADHIDHVDHIDHFDHADHIDHVDHVDHFDHADHIDHVDHVDHFDHADQIDHVDHVDHFDHADQIDHVDHVDHFDHADQIDHVDHIDNSDHLDYSNHYNDTTPAPFMLLLSSFLLVFGISGIILYYSIISEIKFIILLATPLIAYISTRLISYIWRKIARSRYYNISSTMNLIGQEGEVILRVDDRGGVIKIQSNTPMKFEKMHVKPLKESISFEKGTKIYICDIKDGFFLIDSNQKSIRNRRGYRSK
ncbi:MAG: NfeD family protein, partial [Promethearchaeota archaeon]